ncbi:hypothetical protein [Streptomyces prasinopilosus]|uniref:MmyB family transcriptional regulator n=1 Tax=Streptomyces prasinopilosus TaxID=67344 RepID=UPI001F0AA285|nr:hypothetical protein [Streptomyces prasinopilosus]
MSGPQRGELGAADRQFAALWAGHTVEPCGRDVYDLAHPVVGDLTVTQQTFHVPQEPHQSLVTFTTEPESASSTALAVLQQACGSGEGPG